MAYRFVHAADIHLNSPLRSLALRDAELAELIGNSTRRAFVTIVDLCLDEQVDALLLAGDLHDGDQTSMKTARFLAEQIRRLHEAGIRVFVIRGNHDALLCITKELELPGFGQGVRRPRRGHHRRQGEGRQSDRHSRLEFRSRTRPRACCRAITPQPKGQ